MSRWYVLAVALVFVAGIASLKADHRAGRCDHDQRSGNEPDRCDVSSRALLQTLPRAAKAAPGRRRGVGIAVRLSRRQQRIEHGRSLQA
jgi:hypothetical protein